MVNYKIYVKLATLLALATSTFAQEDKPYVDITIFKIFDGTVEDFKPLLEDFEAMIVVKYPGLLVREKICKQKNCLQFPKF